MVTGKFLIIFFEGETTWKFLDDEEIIIYTEENERHDREDDDLVQSVRSLDQNENHHDNRPDPYESPDFFSCPSESQKPMM